MVDLGNKGISAYTKPTKENSDKFCFANGSGRVKKLEQKFGSMEKYTEQCRYFIDKDCSRFDPATKNLTRFFMTAYGLLSGIWDSVKCIVGVIKQVPILKEAYNSLVKWIGVSVAGAAISLLGHYLTMGIWGGIKAAYYIVKIGTRIHGFIQEWNTFTSSTRPLDDGRMRTLKDLVFNFGGIIANAISIVKSLVAGRRRYRKLKK